MCQILDRPMSPPTRIVNEDQHPLPGPFQISNKVEKNTLKSQFTLEITVQEETRKPNCCLIFKGTGVQLSATDADIAL
jgi:hypothetical protein